MTIQSNGRQLFRQPSRTVAGRAHPVNERELKLGLPGRFSMPPLMLDDVALTLSAMPEQTLVATYYDTADLRLARHGASLRRRTGEGDGPLWTVKLPVASGDSALERREVSFADSGREPPAGASTLVTAIARHEPLVAVARLRTRRRRAQLLLDDEAVAELDDDEVSVLEGRRVVSRFRELELEALNDDLDLRPLAAQLLAAGATAAEPIPKVVRALGSRATARPDVAEYPIPPNPTMGDALASALADATVRLVHNDALARLGDAEGVHQVRVALRRLRSDLRTLGDSVDPAWRASVEPGLRAIGTALGSARDLDVLVDSLRHDVDEAGMRALGRLPERLEERRREAYRRLRRALDDDAYVDLLDTLVRAMGDPPIGPDAASPADSALPALVLEVWEQLAHRGDDLTSNSPDADFHRTRIAAKRMRYAAELAARVLTGKRAAGAASLARRVTEIQDVLGAHQDATVAREAIEATVTGQRRPTAYAFEAGRLAERKRLRADAGRTAFLEIWPKVRRRRTWKWAT